MKKSRRTPRDCRRLPEVDPRSGSSGLRRVHGRLRRHRTLHQLGLERHQREDHHRRPPVSPHKEILLKHCEVGCNLLARSMVSSLSTPSELCGDSMNDLNVMASTCSGGRRALFGIGASLGHGESGVAGEHGGKDEGEGDGARGARTRAWVCARVDLPATRLRRSLPSRSPHAAG